VWRTIVRIRMLFELPVTLTLFRLSLESVRLQLWNARRRSNLVDRSSGTHFCSAVSIENLTSLSVCVDTGGETRLCISRLDSSRHHQPRDLRSLGTLAGRCEELASALRRGSCALFPFAMVVRCAVIPHPIVVGLCARTCNCQEF
jgi:hypothetical protein